MGGRKQSQSPVPSLDRQVPDVNEAIKQIQKLYAALTPHSSDLPDSCYLRFNGAVAEYWSAVGAVGVEAWDDEGDIKHDVFEKVVSGVRDANGVDLPMAAALCGQHMILKKMIDSVPGVLNARNKSGETVLHYAAKSSSIETVQEVVRRKVDLRGSIDNEGFFAVHHALMFDDNAAIISACLEPLTQRGKFASGCGSVAQLTVMRALQSESLEISDVINVLQNFKDDIFEHDPGQKLPPPIILMASLSSLDLLRWALALPNVAVAGRLSSTTDHEGYNVLHVLAEREGPEASELVRSLPCLDGEWEAMNGCRVQGSTPLDLALKTSSALVDAIKHWSANKCKDVTSRELVDTELVGDLDVEGTKRKLLTDKINEEPDGQIAADVGDLREVRARIEDCKERKDWTGAARQVESAIEGLSKTKASRDVRGELSAELAKMYSKSNRFEEAREAARMSIACRPALWRGYMLLAEQLVHLDDPEEAAQQIYLGIRAVDHVHEKFKASGESEPDQLKIELNAASAVLQARLKQYVVMAREKLAR